MKVLLINGSPHKEGCTFVALSEVAKVLNENGINTEIMHLGLNPIAGCIGCGFCKKESKCFRDDVVNTFIEKAKLCDGFVFGTPVHFSSASGAITSFLDRAFMIKNTALAYKPAAVVVSCRRGGASATFDQINKYFTIRCMPIVSSNYWNMVHGSNPSEVIRDEEGMQTMRVLGSNMSWLLKCIESGRNSGIEKPICETKIYTNYIR